MVVVAAVDGGRGDRLGGGSAMSDGPPELGSPIARPHKYLRALSAVEYDPAGFLAQFADIVAHRRFRYTSTVSR